LKWTSKGNLPIKEPLLQGELGPRIEQRSELIFSAPGQVVVTNKLPMIPNLIPNSSSRLIRFQKLRNS
jgi:hypothetical protein